LSSEKWRINKKALLLIRKLVGAHLSGPSNNPQLKNAHVGQILEENVMDIKIITVASEMTSNISKLNNNNFHPESSIYMNSLRRHLSRIVIFPACAPKAILSPHSPTPSQKPLELFIFWIFMLCVVFFFSFFYIEPTIFCVRCAWQMAKSGEFAWLHVHTGIASLFVCLSGK